MHAQHLSLHYRRAAAYLVCLYMRQGKLRKVPMAERSGSTPVSLQCA